MFPSFFQFTQVLDAGSLDINGNNRYLFEGAQYWGIDILGGKNVDQVISAANFSSIKRYSVVITTEMLEHDAQWKESLLNLLKHLEPGGLFIMTCATEGRPEHGTKRTTPEDSPATTDYYLNITWDMLYTIPGFLDKFSIYRITTDKTSHDLQFWGIKNLSGKDDTFLHDMKYVKRIFNPSKVEYILTYLVFFYRRRMVDYRNFVKRIFKTKKP